jgi:probable F420-dependent oxidoreductase
MKLGISIRNMGPQSSREIISTCAITADQEGLDSLWITEHIAIPPDDAEGSGGRYLDPLITLSYLAAKTEQIKLGTGVLILPYRPPMITAKLIATLQELAAGRVKLGIGIGWMRSEFKALGLDLRKRVSDSERVLQFMHDAFGNDVVSQHDQSFIFSPRPIRPPIIVGGAAPHAIKRAVKFGDGWMPMGLKPDVLKPLVEDYKNQSQKAGKDDPEVVVMCGLPLQDSGKCREILEAYKDAGATTVVHGQKYDEAIELQKAIRQLASMAM